MRGRVIPYILGDGRIIEVVIEANPVTAREEELLKLIRAKGELLEVNLVCAGGGEDKRAIGFGFRYVIDYMRNEAGRAICETEILTPEQAKDFIL